MNATRARGKTNKVAPIPDKGVLIRKPAVCDRCDRNCTVTKYGHANEDGYYTYYDEKLCKVCIKGVV
jgi:hypothetical protein